VPPTGNVHDRSELIELVGLRRELAEVDVEGEGRRRHVEPAWHRKIARPIRARNGLGARRRAPGERRALESEDSRVLPVRAFTGRRHPNTHSTRFWPLALPKLPSSRLRSTEIRQCRPGATRSCSQNAFT